MPSAAPRHVTFQKRRREIERVSRRFELLHVLLEHVRHAGPLLERHIVAARVRRSA